MRSSASTPASEMVELLFRQHAAGLRRLLRGILRDEERAEEALQQTFVRLLESGGTVETGRHRAWLQRVAVREALALRKAQHGQASAIERGVRRAGLAEGSDTVAPEEMATRQERLRRAATLIERLPAEQREVLELHLRRGWSFREIAEHAGIPRGTALTRMRLAMEKLRVLRHEEEAPRRSGGPEDRA